MAKQFDILIVEDEQVVSNVANRILMSAGFNVDMVYDAETALEKLKQNEYKLILSDLMLPNISGIELIKKVKSTNPDILFIIITGYAKLENAVKSFKAGAFDFIPKPFDLEELLGVVSRAMKHLSQKQASVNEKKQSQTKHTFNGETGEYFCLGEHSWAKPGKGNLVTIGVGKTFPARVGTIQQIELPFINTEVWQGNMCVRIISEDNLINMVWTPLSGNVVEINQKVKKNMELINTDPFNHGWLIKIIPTNLEYELGNLSRI